MIGRLSAVSLSAVLALVIPLRGDLVAGPALPAVPYDAAAVMTPERAIEILELPSYVSPEEIRSDESSLVYLSPSRAEEVRFDESYPTVSTGDIEMSFRGGAFAPARPEGGRVIYEGIDSALVYAPSPASVKEDLVLYSPVDRSEFTWRLVLPDDASARLRDDGSIGIYQVADAPFGGVKFCGPSSADAGETSTAPGRHERLVARMPAPRVYDCKGRVAESHYVLGSGSVTVRVEGLGELEYPVTIDPSITFDAFDDFRKNSNNEGMIRYTNTGSVSVAGEIRRAKLGGGNLTGFVGVPGAINGRYAHGSFIYNSCLYVVGGIDSGGSYLTSIQYAPINSDGSLNPFQTATALTNPRAYFGAVAYNGFLYVVGGESGPFAFDPTIQYIRILADGSLDTTWSYASAALPFRLKRFGCVAHRGFIYTAGGQDEFGFNSSIVQWFRLMATGDIEWSNWSNIGPYRKDVVLVAHDNHLYTLGGNDFFGVDQAQVEYSTIQFPYGDPSYFQPTSNLLSVRSGLSAAVVGGYLVVAGGGSPDLEMAPVGSGGAVGDWKRDPSSFDARRWAGYAGTHDRLYVTGGSGASGVQADVRHFAMTPPGGVTNLTTRSPFVPGPRLNHSAVTCDGKAFIFGGNYDTAETQYSSDIWMSDISPGKPLFGWNFNPAGGLPENLALTGCAIYGDWVYIVGGQRDFPAPPVRDSLWAAQINANGVFGWWYFTLPSSVRSPGCFVRNGKLYVVGGDDGNIANDSVFTHRIDLDSSGYPFGGWTSQAHGSGLHTRAAVECNGTYAYIAGGAKAGAPTTEVLKGTFDAAGNVTWTATTALPGNRYSPISFIANEQIYVGGGKSALAAAAGQASMVHAPILQGGGLGSWTTTTYQDAEYGGKALFYSGVLYDLCGADALGPTSSSDMIPVNPSGTIAGWDSYSNSYPEFLTGVAATAWNGRLYTSGGANFAYNDTVFRAYVGYLAPETKTVGYWGDFDLDDLPSSRAYHGMAAYNNTIYAFGGEEENGAGSVELATTIKIGVDPFYGYSNTPWTATGAMQEAIAVPGSAQYKNYIYVVGGVSFTLGTVSPTVQRGTIDPVTGAVTWISSTSNPAELNPIAVERYGAGVAVYNDKLYVAAGYNYSVGSVPTVEMATINPANGDVGPFTRATDLPTRMWMPGCFAQDGFLYVAGGGFPASKKVYRAALAVDGAVGQWSEISNLPFLDDGGGCYVSHEGNLYSIAGGFTALSWTVLHSSLLTPAHRGTWSVLHDFTENTALTSILFDSASASKVGVSFTLRSENSGYFFYFPPFARQAVTVGTPFPLGTLQTRYAHLVVELDDTKRASLGLDAGGGSIERDVEKITIVHNTTPSVGTLHQKQNPSLADIAAGGGTTSSSVNFTATINDPDGDNVRLYVEYCDLDFGQSFGIGAVAFEPGFSSSAAPHTLLIGGLFPGHRYIWRAWAEDAPSNVQGSKVAFPVLNGYSFYVDQAPTGFFLLDQCRSDGVFSIPVGGDNDSSTVVIKGVVSDPDAFFLLTPSVRMQVELKPVGSPLNGTGLVDSALVFDLGETTVTYSGLPPGNYHWQARVADVETLSTSFVDFGNPPGVKDFGIPVAATDPPALPSSIVQRNPPAGAGALIDAAAAFESTGDTIVFEAGASDPNGDTVKLQIEVRRIGETFGKPSAANFAAAKAGEPDNYFETALGAAGTKSISAAIGTLPGTLEGLADTGKYKWQVRVVDANGTGCPWTPFVNSSGSDPDFRIDQINDAPVVVTPGQFFSDGVTFLNLVGTAAGVTFKAALSDVNAANPDGTPPSQVKFQVEVRPWLAGFTSPAPGAFPVGGDGVNYFESVAQLGTGAVAIALPIPLNIPGTYWWQYRAVDTGGLVSPGDWTPYGVGFVPDFQIVPNGTPFAPTNAAQLTAGGLTNINDGYAVTSGAVTFRADLNDPGPSGQYIKLQVELRQVGDPFKSPVTIAAFATQKAAEPARYFESFASLGPALFQVTTSALADGAYAWQLRTVDVDGGVSSWIPFGSADADVPDFRVESANNDPLPPTGLTQLTPPDDRPVVVGGVIIGHTALLKAEARDPENGTVALDFEVRPAATAFTNTPTHPGSSGPSGSPVVQTVNDLAVGPYHWQVRSRDSQNRTSTWVEFGGNADADFTIDATVGITPNIPTSLQQWVPSDASVIPLGSTIIYTSFRAKALLIHPRGDAVKLQVEVRRVGDPFLGEATKESGYENSGTLASVSIFGLSDGSWKWRCRAIDSRGGTTDWIEYGGNPGSSSPQSDDFAINTGGAQAPLKPVIIGQFRDNGVTVIPTNGTKSEGTIVIRAFCVDPNGDAVRLAVEAKPLGIPYSQGQFSAVSPLFPNGSEITLNIGGLVDGGYKWRAFTIDSSGSTSAPEEFDSTSVLPDFRVAPAKNRPPEVCTGLDQVKLDGSASVPVGGTTSKFGILLRGSQNQQGDPLNPLDPTDLVRLEVELRPAGVPFAGVPTAVASYNPSGFAGEIATVGFRDGEMYHWQMRNGNSSGKTGTWAAFGGNGDPGDADFVATTTGVLDNDSKGCGSIGFDLLLPLGLLLLWRRAARA